MFNGKLKSTHALRFATVATLAALLVIQTYAYYYRFELSLGPRVILQPWLLQNGYLLYRNIPDEHSPLLYLLLAAPGNIFPVDGLIVAKVALVFLVDLTTVVTFWIAKRTMGWFGALGALFFICWSVQLVSGKLWHETLLMPVYALFLLFRPEVRSDKSVFLMGLIGGVAILIKQHSLALIAACILWNCWALWQARRSVAYVIRQTAICTIAVVLPVALFGLYYYFQGGNLADLAFWTIGFNFASGYAALGAKLPTLDDIPWLIAAYFLVPVAIVDMVRLVRKGDRRWVDYGWGLSLLLAATLTAFPRFDFFHLQASLPILAWLCTFTLYRIVHSSNTALSGKSPSRIVPSLVIAVVLVWIGSAIVEYKPAVEVGDAPRIWEYSELSPLATQVREHTGPDSCPFIFPDDEATANLYYILRCAPPSFWVMSYPWFMLEPIQNTLLTEFQKDQPQWLVYFPGRWGMEERAPAITAYIQQNYRAEAQLRWSQGDAWLLKRAP